MSKSATRVWLIALQGFGLPPCPEDLSPPQYASLLFDKFCMVSKAKKLSRYLDWNNLTPLTGVLRPTCKGG